MPGQITAGELRALLRALALDAAPFIRGSGRDQARHKLLASVSKAAKALRLEVSDFDEEQTASVPDSLTERLREDLRRAAADADDARAAEPGFRADLEG